MFERAILFCMWLNGIVLVGVGIWGTTHLVRSEEFVPSIAFYAATLLPLVIYRLLFSRFFGAKEGSDAHAKRRSVAVRLVVAAILYVPTLLVMARASLEDTRNSIVPWGALLFLLLTLWVLCAYLRSWLADYESASPRTTLGPLGRLLQRSKLMIPSRVLLVVGAILPFTGYLLDREDANQILIHEREWITAEYGLGYHLQAARVVLGYLGPLAYAATLLAAALIVILLFINRFSAQKLRRSRVIPPLKALLVMACILTVADYFYSWIWFISDGVVAMHLVLIALFLIQWAVPVIYLTATRRENLQNNPDAANLRQLMFIFYLPMVLFVIAMAPFFVAGSDFLNCATAYLGVLFLTAGVLDLSARQPLSTRENST